MEKIFIKPGRPGLIVRHPEKLEHIINEEGEFVIRSPQWDRYLKYGDVVRVEPPKKTKGEK